MGLFDDAVDLYKQAVGTAVKHVPLLPPGTPGGLINFDQIDHIRNGIGELTGWDQDGKGGGGAPRNPARNGARKAGGSHPVLDFIMRTNPGIASRHEARKIRDDYLLNRQLPGLSDFAREKTGQPDPNTMQMFFAKTVQPYLQQTANQFNAGAQAGTAAMQSILSGAEASGGGSPAIDVLKQWLPVQQAGQMQQGAALDAATRTAPMYDQLLNQLNENIQQQQRTQYYDQALAAGGAGQQQNPNDIGGTVVAGAARAAAK